MSKRRQAEAKLTGQTQEYTDGSRGTELPTDVPAYLRVYRLMQNTPEHRPPAVTSQGLKGWTIVLDCFTFGVEVLVRIGTDGTLRVFTRDADETEKLTEYIRG